MYKIIVDETLVGFAIYLDEEKATEKILSYCKKKFGDDLPNRAEEIIKKRVTENWKAGKLEANLKKDVWKVTDEKAVTFFRENDKFFLGSQYDKFSDDIRKVIDDELTGTARSHDKKVVDRLRKKMGDALDHPKIKGYYDGVIRNSVNRSRNYSRAFGFEEAGIKELEIVAILDDATSDVCREMNGRRIEVKVAADFVRDVISSPVADFDAYTETFPWPSSKDVKAMPGKTTGDIVKGLKCKLPPYHYKCRTTYIAGFPVQVTNRNGKVLSKRYVPKANAENEKQGKRIDGYLEKKNDELSALTDDELASKINALQTSDWYDDVKFQNHFTDHGEEVEALNGEEYRKQSKKYLQNFDRIFLFNLKGKPRVNFVNTKDNRIVGVDPSEQRITTYYKLRDSNLERFEERYIELQ